ncbi:hypothetical protein N7451_012661 [Penicillium sp. IBT 35674x]|nr:hypothetical protein N7451_012661 [Penicillium sp. IBT 35674x]
MVRWALRISILSLPGNGQAYLFQICGLKLDRPSIGTAHSVTSEFELLRTPRGFEMSAYGLQLNNEWPSIYPAPPDSDINHSVSLDDDGNTPLGLAARCGDLPLVKLLLKWPVPMINAPNFHGVTPLAQGQPLEATELSFTDYFKLPATLLQQDDILADSRNIYGETPLALAAERGHCDVVKLLVKPSDVEIDSSDREGCTPLARAAAMGHADIVHILINHSAVNVNSKDCDGYTWLAWAARRGHCAVTRVLMGHVEIDAESEDDDGFVPLIIALDEGNKDVIRAICEA